MTSLIYLQLFYVTIFTNKKTKTGICNKSDKVVAVYILQFLQIKKGK